MGMKRYRNLSGNSGVVAYETGPDWIDVKFTGGDDVYRYDHDRPGEAHVQAMKVLAMAGRGLAAYISRNVDGAYAEKRE